MTCISTALIVGGGIAGLSAAIALAKVGVRCDVVELAAAPQGASLGMHGRAAEALDELGVYNDCYAAGTPWTRDSTPAGIMNAEGRLLSPSPQRPEWPGIKTSFGIYRPVLIQILTAAAQRIGGQIHRGVTTENITERADGAYVTLSSGEQRRYDCVIGADGIGSRLRSLTFPDAPVPAYSGQMSIRWLAPGPAIYPEGWYLGSLGRVGFYYLPQNVVYVPAVIDSTERLRLGQAEVFSLFKRLLDSYTAPAIVELRNRLTPDAEIICRPFEWILLEGPWFRGRTILIGDAAHATTAHMAMGGGMAVEDAVVLASCIGVAATLTEAFEAFMLRRRPRVQTVVQTSVALSRLEQEKAPPAQNRALLMSAFETLAQPY